MTRTLRLFFLLAFLAASAGILWWSAGGPRLPALPSLEELRQSLSSSYMPIESVLGLLGLLGWALWFYLLGAVCLRIVAMAAVRLSLPGAKGLVRLSETVTPRFLRRLLDVALGSILALSLAGGSVAEVKRVAYESDVVPAATSLEQSPQPTPAEVGEGSERYLVRPGDSLWKIAESQLGSGRRWPEIYELNAGKEMGNGRRLVNPHLIRPGWPLQLPGPAEVADEPPTPPPLDQAAVLETPDQRPTPPSDSTSFEAHDDQNPSEEVTEKSLRKVVRVELPDGGAMAGSFAAGILAASIVGRLRRRRRRKLGEGEPSRKGPKTVEAATRVGIDPKVDTIGPASEAVLRSWARELGKTPSILAAWERPEGCDFLLDDSGQALPAPVTEPGQRIAYTVRDGRVLATVTGFAAPSLRPGAFAAADGLLVPVGFTEDAALHIPLVGPFLGICADEPAREQLLGSMITAAAIRLGHKNLRVFLSGSIELPSIGVAIDEFPADSLEQLCHAIELEVLRRGRLFLEEGSEEFRQRVLDHPDVQLAAILVVVNSRSFGLIKRVLRGAEGTGIGVLVMGEQQAPRRIEVSERGSLIALGADSDRIEFEPMMLSSAVLLDCESIVRSSGEEPGGEEMTDSDEERPAVDKRPDTEVSHGTEAADIKVFCLGRWRIERDGETVSTGWRRKALELLGLLIANPHGIRKESILEALWPRYKPKERPIIERDFHRFMSDVRIQLRGEKKSHKIVLREDDVYRLDFGRVWVDAAAFEEAVKSARDSGRPESELREAVALYRGDFCEGHDYWWKEATAQRLRNTFVDAAVGLAEKLQEKSEWDEALDILDRAIETDRYAEALYRRAMEMEVELGRRDGVVEGFRNWNECLPRLTRIRNRRPSGW